MPTNFFTYEIGGAVFIALVAFLGTNSFYATATFLYFWSYRGQINGLFNRFFEIKDRLADCELSSARMMELYDEKRFPVESFGKNELKNIKGKIQFEKVEYAYETNKKILDGISFTIKPNSITAIVGKTGCGKSTTLSLIARFNDANKGKITIDGKNIKSLTKSSLRKNIAYVQQNPYIFNRSFKGNLLLVKPDATDEEIIDACKKAEIHDFITTTENGYDTIIGENGITLSGGQRQRLAIARAIINTVDTGKVESDGNILFAYPSVCKSDAETHATTPTILPAERSVPVSIMQAAIPRAIGKFAAESEIMLTIDGKDKKRGLII